MLTPCQSEVLDMLAQNLLKHDWARLKALCLELFRFDLDARAWIDLEPDLSDIADPWNAPDFDPTHAEIARLQGELAAANLLMAKLQARPSETTVEPVPDADILEPFPDPYAPKPDAEIPEAARRMIDDLAIHANRNGGVPASAMPEAPRPTVARPYIEQADPPVQAELKHLPSATRPWSSSLNPEAWEIALRWLVRGEAPISTAAHINMLVANQDPRMAGMGRVKEQAVADFHYNNKSVISYLRELSADDLNRWFAAAKEANQAKYAKKVSE